MRVEILNVVHLLIITEVLDYLITKQAKSTFLSWCVEFAFILGNLKLSRFQS